MSQVDDPMDIEGLWVEIDPEPSEEEFVAILEVVRSLSQPRQPARPAAGGSRSRWADAARREALRPADWPLQRVEWVHPRG